MSELKIKPANEIIFDNHYKKLKDYKTGTVIFTVGNFLGKHLKTKYCILTYIDTLRDDNRFYIFNDDVIYMVVFLVSERGEIFTTIRKDNDENRCKYKVGMKFVIKIEE